MGGTGPKGGDDAGAAGLDSQSLSLPFTLYGRRCYGGFLKRAKGLSLPRCQLIGQT